MSNIDKRALREAAEKATSGKWERGDGNGNGGELLVYCDDALGSAICEMTSEYNAIPKYQRINNLNFIAAANPATVLTLLDELEEKDRRIAELEMSTMALRG
ncbi:TPA: ead/Ea22-like family protein [Enterobacter roggenkampii]